MCVYCLRRCEWCCKRIHLIIENTWRISARGFATNSWARTDTKDNGLKYYHHHHPAEISRTTSILELWMNEWLTEWVNNLNPIRHKFMWTIFTQFPYIWRWLIIVVVVVVSYNFIHNCGDMYLTTFIGLPPKSDPSLHLIPILSTYYYPFCFTGDPPFCMTPIPSEHFTNRIEFGVDFLVMIVLVGDNWFSSYYNVVVVVVSGLHLQEAWWWVVRWAGGDGVRYSEWEIHIQSRTCARLIDL